MGIGGARGGKGGAGLGDWIAAESISLAAEAANIPVGEITSPARERAKAAFARQVAMYLAHCIGQMSMSELAGIFKRDRTTVAHAVAAIEDRRDDAFFSAQLDILEAELKDRLALIVERCKQEAQRARDRGRMQASAPRRRL